MQQEKFCLAWDKFEATASRTFKNLYLNQDYVDVTLVCDEEKQIKAHKLILSSSSTFFRRILKLNQHQNYILYLKGIKYNDLKAAIKFLYFGQVEVAHDELDSFMAVAKDLEIEGLQYQEDDISKAVDTLEEQENLTVSDLIFEHDRSYPILPVVELQQDSEYHGVSNQADLSCDKCGKIFNHTGTFNRHKKTVHGGVRYPCTYCGKAFTQSGALAQHVKISHTLNF